MTAQAAQADTLTPLAHEIEEQLETIRKELRKPLHSAFAAGRLTAAQRTAMRALVMSDGLSLKALSQQLGLAHSTVSGIVDRLEARGMVERTRVRGDARLTSIVPTRAVRDFLKTEMPALAVGPLVEALGRATPAQRDVIREGVSVLYALLNGGYTKNAEKRSKAFAGPAKSHTPRSVSAPDPGHSRTDST